MRFLLDQGLPRSTFQHLRGADFDVEHVGDLGLASASDEAILRAGRRSEAVIVTLDADFHALLALTGEIFPSVIRIRIEGLRGDDVAQIIRRVFDAVGDDLAAGSAVTVTPHRVAVRRLPLVVGRNPKNSR